MERVLITGAAGTIGRALRDGLRGAYPVLRLSDIAPLGAAGPGEELAAQMAPEDEPEVERSFHGGPFTGMGFSGDVTRID